MWEAKIKEYFDRLKFKACDLSTFNTESLYTQHVINQYTMQKKKKTQKGDLESFPPH